MENAELSLHYTLTQDDDIDLNDSTEVKDDTELEKNAKEDNVDATSAMSVDKEETENVEEAHENTANNDDGCGAEEEDEEDDDDEDEDENEKLRKEMEQSWAKEEEKEKNQGMIELLMQIRNKHSPKKDLQKQQKQKPKSKTLDDDHVPKINPFVFDGNLKITFDGKPTQKEQTAAHCNGYVNTLQKRKRLKTDLRQQLHKKRKQEMKQYRKEFGRYRDQEQHYAHVKQLCMPEEGTRTQSVSSHDEPCDADGNGNNDDDVEIEQTLPASLEDDIGALTDDDDDDDDDDDAAMEEEELARAALMQKQEVISKEVRELLDIAADEEDEYGEVVTTKNDHEEREEKAGIASNLLAEKAEIKLLKKHKQIYDEKRNQIHRHMVGATDDSDLELMKRAFIDGEYRKLQSKRRQKDIRFLNMDDGDGGEGQQALAFKSRNFELDPRNEPEFYLSDNEEKNEFCCYDENGLFYDVHTIRMRIMEWRRKHHSIVHDDEEDKEEFESRQKRVQRRELLNQQQQHHAQELPRENGGGGGGGESDNNNKISESDKHAVKILEKLRNKKRKKNKNKKPTLTKSASTMGINFDAFYKDKGLTIPVLQRNASSSFLQCRNKSMDINKTIDSTNQSLPASTSLPFKTDSSISRSKKIVVFQNTSRSNSMLMKNSKKRRREDMNVNANDACKKRRTR